MRFRKKSVVVEAWPVSDLMHRYCVREWTLPGAIKDAIGENDLIFSTRHIAVKTLEGLMDAGPSDWLIRGVKGELYPCKSDIFEATYEPVEESNA